MSDITLKEKKKYQNHKETIKKPTSKLALNMPFSRYAL